MPPLRRYLRISQYSVLEVRVYLDTPADLHRWLLREPAPVLPRIISAVRPLVLPKLQEENAQAKKGKRRKGWKDTVVEEDFEIAVFLTETSSRHSILRKEKVAKSEKVKLGTVGGKMTGSKDAPMEVGEDAPGPREDSEDGSVTLADLPPAVPQQESREGLFISDDEGDENVRGLEKGTAVGAQSEQEVDDKKKLGLNTTYDGFSIYGRILCLVVKRRGTAKGKEQVGGAAPAMMEGWISSTQMREGVMMDE